MAAATDGFPFIWCQNIGILSQSTRMTDGQIHVYTMDKISPAEKTALALHRA